MPELASICEIEVRASRIFSEEKSYRYITLNKENLNNNKIHKTSQIIESCANQDGFTVFNLSNICKSLDHFREILSKFAAIFGNLMVQNDLGHTVIEVFDRRIGKIDDGVRYHQTRQGGDIHTDSVNRPEAIRYLMLACAAPGLIGGETILVRAQDIYKRLLQFPDFLEILQQEYFFEGRGMSQEYALFKIPVLEMCADGPRFRYLRSYIASAHKNAGNPLSARQLEAFDALDALLETSSLQIRINLTKGDVLVVDDTAVFHGRTSFVDGKTENSYTDHRHMLRYWIV